MESRVIADSKDSFCVSKYAMSDDDDISCTYL